MVPDQVASRRIYISIFTQKINNFPQKSEERWFMDSIFISIYQILYSLREGLDNEEPKKDRISSDSLGLSTPKWSRIIKMLYDEGYIKGIAIVQKQNYAYPDVVLVNPTITIKGLEYLQENPMMIKAFLITEGIVELI